MDMKRMWTASAFALGLVGAACGSGSPSRPAPAAEGAAGCHPELAVKPAKPVTVTLWAYNSSIDELAAGFNRAQTAVHVNVERKGNPQETANAYFGAAASHRGMPDVVQLPGFATAAAIDSGSVAPAQACIDASGYDFADFLPETLATTRVAGTQWGMPAGLDDGDYSSTTRRPSLAPASTPLALRRPWLSS